MRDKYKEYYNNCCNEYKEYEVRACEYQKPFNSDVSYKLDKLRYHIEIYYGVLKQLDILINDYGTLGGILYNE